LFHLSSSWDVCCAFGREDPLLGSHLHRVPGAAERRRIAEVEIIHRLDGHAVMQRQCEHVDSLGDLGLPVSDNLSAEKLTRGAVPSDSDHQLPGTGVVRLVVIMLTECCQWVEAACGCFCIPQSGSRNSEFKHLHD